MISSGETIDLIRKHKNAGKALYATTSYLNLIHTDDDIQGFNVNFKVIPPLRNKADQKSLIKAAREGIIQAVVSNHDPKEEEIKHLEFSNAAFGATGLETCFAKLNESLGDKLGLDRIIELLAQGPRKILQLDIPQILENEKANLCIFDPELEWTFDRSTCKSKSVNNPYIGTTLKGKVIAVVNGSKVVH